MSDKFKGQYRIESARLQNWDYSNAGMYFITICTANREPFFGNIRNGLMQLSEIGKLAEIYWHEIPLHFPFAAIDEFVVMPDHIHGIIIISKQDDNGLCSDRDAINRVCTDVGGVTGIKNPMLSDNLSRIVRWYKGRVSFESRKIHVDFMWQSRFYDHIIRNDEALQRIRNYIRNNPLKWSGNQQGD